MISRICSLLKIHQPLNRRGLLFSSGDTVPSDATDGFQTGCIFQHTDGGVGTSLYINEGSVTSCNFNKIPGIGSAGIEVSDTPLTSHAFYVSSAASGGKNAFRAGSWGSEVDFPAGYGLFRIYGKVSTGTDATTLGFIRALAVCTAPISAFQFYADCDAATPGPTGVHAADFFAVINGGKYLAASVAAGDGLIASWHKVTAPPEAIVNGNVSVIWLDNQVNSAVGGYETTILSTCGGTVPDSWARFRTTSNGWAALLSFDSTMVDKQPLSALKPGTDPTFTGSLIIDINGTPYYIPYAAAGGVS